jgi:hypothetical protein
VENVAQEYATFLGVRTVCTFLSLAEEFMPHASFDGLRVLSLESRRAREVERLIRTYNGEPFVVPAMREVPLESNAACLQFAADLLAGRFDLLLFLTGVGVRAMMDIVTPHQDCGARRETAGSAARPRRADHCDGRRAEYLARGDPGD